MPLVPCRLVGALVAAWMLANPASVEAQPGAFAPFADSLMSAQLEARHIPGAVLVEVRDGRVTFARGYGFADLERRIPVDAERTVFRVASVSKLFTATAAMQLVEQGRLDLHDDVNQYLRRFRVPRGDSRPVTLFDLLTHAAGFDDSNIARKAHSPSAVEPLGDYLARHLPPRIRPPGEFICYSNHGMALAGYLVEVASGMPFAQYMEQRVFAPLGMMHSTFDITPDSTWQQATGYGGDPPRPLPRDYTKTIPASMLSTTGGDVARFMIAHLEGSEADWSLSAAGIEAMHHRQFSQNPLLAGIGLGFWERYQNGERAVWHDGDAAGFASLLYLIPARRTGYFMAFNSRGGSRARREVLTALLDRDFPRPHVAPPSPAGGQAAGPVSRFAGTYVDMRHGHRSMEKLASLERHTSVRTGAGGALLLGGTRYLPSGHEVFRSEDGEGGLAFREDRAGRVTHLFESRSIARVYERVPWHGTPWIQLSWLLFCMLGFGWTCVDAMIAAFDRRRRAVSGAVGGSGRGIVRATVVVSVLYLAFVVGLVAALTGVFGSLEYGIPNAVVVLFTLPLAATAITLLALAGIVRELARGRWPIANARLAPAMTAALAFVPWLLYWNLLGYHF